MSNKKPEIGNDRKIPVSRICDICKKKIVKGTEYISFNKDDNGEHYDCIPCKNSTEFIQFNSSLKDNIELLKKYIKKVNIS